MHTLALQYFNALYDSIYYIRLTCSPAWIFKSQVSLGFDVSRIFSSWISQQGRYANAVRHESSNSIEIARIQASQQVSNKLLLEPPSWMQLVKGGPKRRTKFQVLQMQLIWSNWEISFVSLSYLIQIHQLILPGPCPTSQQRGFRRTSGEGWQRLQAHIISTQQPQIAECPNSERIRTVKFKSYGAITFLPPFLIGWPMIAWITMVPPLYHLLMRWFSPLLPVSAQKTSSWM